MFAIQQTYRDFQADVLNANGKPTPWKPTQRNAPDCVARGCGRDSRQRSNSLIRFTPAAPRQCSDGAFYRVCRLAFRPIPWLPGTADCARHRVCFEIAGGTHGSCRSHSYSFSMLALERINSSLLIMRSRTIKSRFQFCSRQLG